jgi:hypothetical protein
LRLVVEATPLVDVRKGTHPWHAAGFATLQDD